jgi:hypothetical protein
MLDFPLPLGPLRKRNHQNESQIGYDSADTGRSIDYVRNSKTGPRLDLQVHTLEDLDLLPARVSKADVFESDRSLSPRFERLSYREGDGGFTVEQVEYPSACSDTLHETGPETGKTRNGASDVAVCDKRSVQVEESLGYRYSPSVNKQTSKITDSNLGSRDKMSTCIKSVMTFSRPYSERRQE